MILVTGGAGYIGSHCVLALLDRGYDVVIFDNLSNGHIETVETLKKNGNVQFVRGDLRNSEDIEKLFDNYSIDAVVHFAAFALVGEFVSNPEKYYINNVAGTLNLLSAMLKHNVKKIVFSSTAATYGEPEYIPIDENHPQKPINPYGTSKLMVERILDDYSLAYDLKSVRLRYFNVVGADSQGRVGEWHEPETHIVPNVLKSSFTNGKVFKLFGTDYDTKDGTCVRDYINVEDLAQAHILALKYLANGGTTNYFNLGTKSGDTVKEVFSVCEDVIGSKLEIEESPRRAGDPASLVADNEKVKNILNWAPLKDLKYSVTKAYEWEKKIQEKLNSVTNKIGFTLAEVLIALAIVGAIALAVLPGVITKSQDKAYQTSYNATITTLLNSLNALPMLEGQNSFSKTMMHTEEVGITDFENSSGLFLKKYMQIVKYCGNTPNESESGCFASDYKKIVDKQKTVFNINEIKGACALLRNGVSICLRPEQKLSEDGKTSYISGWLDANGPKGPNIYGRDFRTFVINMASGQAYETEAGEVDIYVVEPQLCLPGESCNILPDCCQIDAESKCCCIKRGLASITSNTDVCCKYYSFAPVCSGH